MRRDGLRIDPKARPYGMQAIDLLAELVQGRTFVFDEPLPEHGRRLLAALGVRVCGHNGHGRGSLGCGAERTFRADSTQRSG